MVKTAELQHFNRFHSARERRKAYAHDFASVKSERRRNKTNCNRQNAGDEIRQSYAHF